MEQVRGEESEPVFRYRLQSNTGPDSNTHYIYNTGDAIQAQRQVLDYLRGREALELLSFSRSLTETLEAGILRRGIFQPKRVVYSRPLFRA